MASSVGSGWSAIREDFELYARIEGARSPWERWALPFRAPSLWTLGAYRLGHAARAVRPTWLGRPLRLATGLAYQVLSRVTKISLPLGARVEPGVWLGSFAPLIVAPGTVVGRGTRLHAGVTLGVGGRPGARGVPSLGRNVCLSPGAVVVGKVTLGEGVVVAPNSVVTRSQETAAALVGAPAKPWGGAVDRWIPKLEQPQTEGEP
jgi:serine acetyltransferase